MSVSKERNKAQFRLLKKGEFRTARPCLPALSRTQSSRPCPRVCGVACDAACARVQRAPVCGRLAPFRLRKTGIGARAASGRH